MLLLEKHTLAILDNVFIISPNSILVVLNNLLTGCSQHKPFKISLQVYKFKMGVISGTYFWEENLKVFLQLIMRGSISALSHHLLEIRR